MGRLMSVGLGLLLAAAGTASAGDAAAASTSGKWAGKTKQQKAISFATTGNRLKGVSIAFKAHCADGSNRNDSVRLKQITLKTNGSFSATTTADTALGGFGDHNFTLSGKLSGHHGSGQFRVSYAYFTDTYVSTDCDTGSVKFTVHLAVQSPGGPGSESEEAGELGGE